MLLKSVPKSVQQWDLNALWEKHVVRKVKVSLTNITTSCPPSLFFLPLCHWNVALRPTPLRCRVVLVNDRFYSYVHLFFFIFFTNHVTVMAYLNIFIHIHGMY